MFILLFIGFLPVNLVPFLPNNFLTLPIICLNNGFKILFNKGVNVAAVVATIVIANVVDTVFIEGRYFSTFVVGVHNTTHSYSINLNPVTFSVPALFK